MTVEWSADAVADLDRFADFLHRHFPTLARVVAREMIEKANILSGQPLLGRPIAGHEHYRQIVLQVLNAAYVIQCRVGGERVIILRVFHGRETRT
jgi:plasmid stabilization system protein ParE